MKATVVTIVAVLAFASAIELAMFDQPSNFLYWNNPTLDASLFSGFTVYSATVERDYECFACSSGWCFGIPSGNSSALFRLDPSTGVSTLVGNFSRIDIFDWEDCTMDPNDPSTLYAFSEEATEFVLFTIDVCTLDITRVGGVNVMAQDAGFAHDGTSIWGVTGSNLYELNPVTLGVIGSASGSINTQWNAAYNPDDGFLYSVGQDFNQGPPRPLLNRIVRSTSSFSATQPAVYDGAASVASIEFFNVSPRSCSTPTPTPTPTPSALSGTLKPKESVFYGRVNRFLLKLNSPREVSIKDFLVQPLGEVTQVTAVEDRKRAPALEWEIYVEGACDGLLTVEYAPGPITGTGVVANCLTRQLGECSLFAS